MDQVNLPKDLQSFKKLLQRDEVTGLLEGSLLALWKAGKGDWEGAHSIVQDDPGKEAAWIHAYLHRAEGDLGNASYWYRRAGKPVAEQSLELEWADIVSAML